MSQNQVLYEKSVRKHPRRVFFEGDGALAEGTGLCYNADYIATGGAATDVDGRRDMRVELPGTTNTLSFAGVTARQYNAKTGGQWIEIYEPGSVCLALFENVGALTAAPVFAGCLGGTTIAADIGKFYVHPAIQMGRGACQVLQTSVAGELSLVKLLDGPDSGMCENAVLVDNGATALMPYGTTLVEAQTIGTGNATYVLPDGLFSGQQKTFFLVGTVTTNNLAVSLATTGRMADQVTTGADSELSVLTMDTAGDNASLIWTGALWRNLAAVGATVETNP